MESEVQIDLVYTISLYEHKLEQKSFVSFGYKKPIIKNQWKCVERTSP